MDGIFISYRRDDSETASYLIFDHLQRYFGKNQIFFDIKTLMPGMDFVDSIDTALAQCDVLIAVIGRAWLNIMDSQGQRRLDKPDDFVRLEIATALRRGILVIPVLVERATFPAALDLPDDLKSLQRRQALTISNERFEYDVQTLIDAINRYRKDGPKPQQLSDDLSILIPMFNEENVIGATLKKLKDNGYHDRFHIVICDDASTDNSVSEAERFASGCKNITVIRNQPNGKKVGAIQFGLKRIKTPYVLIVDADSMVTEAQKCGLDAVTNDMRQRKLAAMGFKVRPSPGNLIESLQRLEYLLATDAIRGLFRVTGCLTGHAVIWKVDDLKIVLKRHSGIFEGDDLESTILATTLKPDCDNVDYEADRVFLTTTLKKDLGHLIRQRSLIWEVGLIHVFFDRFWLLMSRRTPLISFFRTFFITDVVAHPFKLIVVLWLLPDFLLSLIHTYPLSPVPFPSETVGFLRQLSETAHRLLETTFKPYLVLILVNVILIASSKWQSRFRKYSLIAYSVAYMLISSICVFLPWQLFYEVRVNWTVLPTIVTYSYWGTSLIASYVLWYGVCAFLILYRATYSRETWTETIRLLMYGLLMPLYFAFLLTVPRTIGFARYFWKRLQGQYQTSAFQRPV